MATADGPLERDENASNLVPADSNPDKDLKGSELAIGRILFILGSYRLAPSPLPADFVAQFAKSDDQPRPCGYCEQRNSKIAFPLVDADFRTRRIKVVSFRVGFRHLQGACELCHRVLDLKGLVSVIKDSLIGKREPFHELYRHFLRVNGLLGSSGNPADELDEEKSTFFQDAVCMAYALSMLMKLVLVTRSDIAWEYSKDEA